MALICFENASRKEWVIPRWGLFSVKYLEICNFPIVIYICNLNLFYRQPVHLQLHRWAVRWASAVPLSAAWLFSKFFFYAYIWFTTSCECPKSLWRFLFLSNANGSKMQSLHPKTLLCKWSLNCLNDIWCSDSSNSHWSWLSGTPYLP